MSLYELTELLDRAEAAAILRFADSARGARVFRAIDDVRALVREAEATDAEAAHERQVEAFYGSSAPQTVAEHCAEVRG
jgi:hypothetical protein